MSVGGRGGPQGLEMDERERLPRSHFYKISSFPRVAQICGLPLLLSAHSWKIAHSTPLLSAHCIGPLFHQNHFGRDESLQSASGEACFVPQFGRRSLLFSSLLFGWTYVNLPYSFQASTLPCHASLCHPPLLDDVGRSVCHPQVRFQLVE